MYAILRSQNLQRKKENTPELNGERPNRYKLETLGTKSAQLIKWGPKWDESNTLGTKFSIKPKENID